MSNLFMSILYCPEGQKDKNITDLFLKFKEADI